MPPPDWKASWWRELEGQRDIVGGGFINKRRLNENWEKHGKGGEAEKQRQTQDFSLPHSETPWKKYPQAQPPNIQPPLPLSPAESRREKLKSSFKGGSCLFPQARRDLMSLKAKLRFWIFSVGTSWGPANTTALSSKTLYSNLWGELPPIVKSSGKVFP